MTISSWSTSAASNNSAPPNGAPEGQTPSSVNNVIRQVMADVRADYEDSRWRDLGHTPTYNSTTSFLLSGDQTSYYTTGRGLKITDSSTLYGTVSSSSYSSPNTTVNVTLSSGSLSASISAIAVEERNSFMPLGVGAVATDLQTRGRLEEYAQDRGATGDGTTDDSSYLTLSDNTGGMILSSGTFRISSDKTFTGITHIPYGDMISVDTGITVAFEGDLVAPSTQIFTGAGSVKIGTKSGIANVIWWGALGTASAATNTTAFQNAVNALKGGPSSMLGNKTLLIPPTKLTSQYYELNDVITLEDMEQVTITGGQGAHVRNNTTDDPIFHIYGNTLGNIFGFHLNNLFLSQQYASNTNGTIKLTKCILSWFTDIYIDNNDCGYGIYMDSSSAENYFENIIIELPGTDGIYCPSDLNHFYGVHVAGAGRYGMHLDSTAQGNTADGLVLYGSGQHGLYVVGANNTCHGVFRNNGKDTANTYDGAYIGGTNNTVGGNAYDDQGSPTQRYGVNLQGTGARKSYLGGSGNVTGLLNASTTAIVDDIDLLGFNSSVDDADTTLTVGTSRRICRYTTALTADRAVTLSTTNAVHGACFRIVRDSGCTGAYNVNVGTGPLKALGSASTWCDVEFNGTSWVLTASGSL